MKGNVTRAVLYVSLLLMAASLLVATVPYAMAEDGDPIDDLGAPLIPNSVIRVNSEAQLRSLIQTNGWQGTGSSTNPYIIHNLLIDAVGYTNAIYIGNTTSHLYIQNCYVFNASYVSAPYHNGGGITLYNVKNVKLMDNTCTGNIYNIYLSRSTTCNITSNTCTDGDESGIKLSLSPSNTVMNNDCSGNDDGILLDEYSDENIVIENNCNNNDNGIVVQYSSENSIENNTCNSNTFNGINIYSPSNESSSLPSSVQNLVAYNTCKDNNIGVLLEYSDDNSLIYNRCEDNNFGIDLYRSDGNMVRNNDCSNNFASGVRLLNSMSITVTRNTCTGNIDYGIYLYNANNNIITVNDCGSNTASGIYLYSSNRNTITNNQCDNNTYNGVHLNTASNNTLTDNLCENNSKGVFLESSHDNTITDNSCDNLVFGVDLYYSDRNLVQNNECSGNADSGVHLHTCVGNTIAFNIINSNTNYGAYLFASQGNHIYGNVFSDNNGATSIYSVLHIQSYDDGINYWNTSTYGNYWNDWTYPDSNHDGIVDDPYEMKGGSSMDNFPLLDAVVAVPEKPSDLTAEGGDEYVDLSWSEPDYTGPGTITYHLFRNGSLIWSGTDLGYNDTSAENGKTYSYTVVAENAIGWGANSTAVVATTAEAKPASMDMTMILVAIGAVAVIGVILGAVWYSRRKK